MFGLQIVDGASSVVFSSGLERTLEFRLWVAGQTNAIGWFENNRKNEKDMERPKNKRITKKNPLLEFLQLFEQTILNTFLNMILHISHIFALMEITDFWIAKDNRWSLSKSIFFLEHLNMYMENYWVNFFFSIALLCFKLMFI